MACILAYVIFNSTSSVYSMCSEVSSVLSGRFAFTTLRSNQIMLYEAIKNTIIVPPRWSSGYEVLSPMSFHEAFTFIVNELQSKSYMNFKLMDLIVTLASIDSHGSDTELAEMSAKFKDVKLAGFDANNYGPGPSFFKPDVFGPSSNKIILQTNAQQPRYFLAVCFTTENHRKSLMTHGFINCLRFFDNCGFSESAAKFAAFMASIAAFKQPIIVPNYSMKASGGGMGLMVADESTRYTPKKIKTHHIEAIEALAEAAAQAAADAAVSDAAVADATQAAE